MTSSNPITGKKTGIHKTTTGFVKKTVLTFLINSHRGVAVECQTRDQEVAGSSLGWALRRKNSGQVSHTYVPLSPSSIIWYRRKRGSKQARRAIH